MEKVQAEGLDALQNLTGFTSELVQLEEPTEAVEILNAMAQEMRWDISVYKADTSILHISCVSRSGQDHLQGIQTDSVQLGIDLRIEVSWLEEEGVLDVLERSFVQLLLLALMQSVLVSHWSNQPEQNIVVG